jgi:NhaA family Na+:H+ antiporter
MAGPRLKEPQTKAEVILELGLSPIKRFMALETASGILLIITTIIAMVWANSAYKESYEHFFHTNISLTIGTILHLEHSLLHWINDGLMVIFFFVVGLEIKRELAIGELSTPKKAALPIFAAIGGMVVPALIYHVFNLEGPGKPGWGIPMATDIAFAVGVLTLLGKRIPFSLKVFLLALAIVDDLGAVLVIAVFYTEQISGPAIGVAGALIGFCILMNKAGVRSILLYLIAGIFIWLAFLKSGVHATIAGVVLGFITPIKAWFEKDFFVGQVSALAEKAQKALKSVVGTDYRTPIPHEAVHTMEELHFLTKETRAPLDRIVHSLHPWVMFLIMPLFALGNAGVSLQGVDLGEVAQHPIAIGTFLGLLLGKPLGIMLICIIAVKAKLASLPAGVTWPQVFGVSVLAGIGFTMALFVSNLALKVPEIEVYSKMGILSASLCASLLGFVILIFTTKKKA